MKINMIKTVVFIVALSFILMFVACDNRTDLLAPGGIDKDLLASMDIVNTSNLFIAKSGDFKSYSLLSDSRSSELQKLFKITDEGYIEEVKYYDDEGNEITIEYQPIAIYNINDEYLIVCFYLRSYLVRKLDGAVFSLDAVGSPIATVYNMAHAKNAKVIQSDDYNNIYYLVDGENGGYYKVIRINLVVGELSSIIDDCVQFYFDFLSSDSMANGATLSFTRIPMQVRCRNCGLSFSPDKSSWICPQCGLTYSTRAKLEAHAEWAHQPVEAPDIIIEPNVEVIVPLPAETPITPAWIYAIIGVGAVLVIALIVLIVRTRRVA